MKKVKFEDKQIKDAYFKVEYDSSTDKTFVNKLNGYGLTLMTTTEALPEIDEDTNVAYVTGPREQIEKWLIEVWCVGDEEEARNDFFPLITDSKKVVKDEDNNAVLSKISDIKNRLKSLANEIFDLPIYMSEFTEIEDKIAENLDNANDLLDSVYEMIENL